MFFDQGGHGLCRHDYRLRLPQGCSFAACVISPHKAFRTGVLDDSLMPSSCIRSSNRSLNNSSTCDGVRRLPSSVSVYLSLGNVNGTHVVTTIADCVVVHVAFVIFFLLLMFLICSVVLVFSLISDFFICVTFLVFGVSSAVRHLALTGGGWIAKG